MNPSEAATWGCIGAIGSEFVYWARLQRTFHENKPAHTTSLFYWFIALVWIGVGAGLPSLYLKAGININFIFCLHAGASAPVFLNQWLKGKVDVE